VERERRRGEKTSVKGEWTKRRRKEPWK
jgi:hypothetical protein